MFIIAVTLFVSAIVFEAVFRLACRVRDWRKRRTIVLKANNDGE